MVYPSPSNGVGVREVEVQTRVKDLGNDLGPKKFRHEIRYRRMARNELCASIVCGKKQSDVIGWFTLGRQGNIILSVIIFC